MGWRTWALSLGLVTGFAIHLQQRTLGPVEGYAGLLALALLLGAGGWLYQRGERANRRMAALPWLAVGVLAASGYAGVRAACFLADALDPELQGQSILVTGQVVSLPQRIEQGERFELAVESAEMRGEPVVLPSRIQLGWYGGEGASAPWAQGPGSPGVRTGERWRFNVRLRSPHGNANPHGFDVELWLWSRGIGATGQVRDGRRDPEPKRLSEANPYTLAAARQWVRDAILERVQDPRAGGVLAAVLVGDQSAIDRADWELFRITGVAHLMVVSGMHVTMFAWMAMALLGVVWPVLARVKPGSLLAIPTPLARLGAGGGVCAVLRLGVASAALGGDAVGGGGAAPGRAPLAVAAGVVVRPGGCSAAGSHGLVAARLLAQLHGGGRAVRHRAGAARCIGHGNIGFGFEPLARRAAAA